MAWITTTLALSLAYSDNAKAAPAPDQPKIISGGLVGHRVCGDFTVEQTTFTFNCDPLPANIDTGWQLTPLMHPNAAGHSVSNRGVILKISTPSFTRIIVEYENEVGNNFELNQIPAEPAGPEPQVVGVHGEVSVASADNGTTKTWTLQFIVSTCTDVAKLNIFNVGADGTRFTNPLVVHLLRDQNEISCPTQLPPVARSMSGQPSMPMSPMSPMPMSLSAEVIAFASIVGATNFGTIDFSKSPPSPPASVTVPYTGASVLTCSGASFAAGNRSLGNIAIFQADSTSHILKLVATADTHFGGIGAIKLNASKILVGEMYGPRVVIIDVSDPSHPKLGPTFTTSIQGINSVGLSGSKAVIAGPNNSVMQILTVTGTTISSPITLDPQLGPGASAAGLKIAMDGTVIAVGPPPASREKVPDGGNGTSVGGPSITVNSPIRIIDISTMTMFPLVKSGLNGVSSIALKGKKVVAGSSNNTKIAMIDFGPSSPVLLSFDPASLGIQGGGWTVTETASRMALGNITGFDLALLNIAGTSFSAPNLLANVNVPAGDIGSICVADF